MEKVEKFVETFDNQGRLVSVHVNPEAKESFTIGTNGQEEMENGKSALRAAVDFYRFNNYGHPQTTFGLHLYKDANLRSFMGTNLGVVSDQYDGDLPIPRPESGWMQVNIRNGRFYLSKFNPEYAELRSRKHDFIDAYILGYGIDIRVLPWNVGNGNNLGLATALMNTWKEPDDQKAYQLKVDGYKKVAARNFANKDIVRARRTGSELSGAVSGAILLNVGGNEVPIEKLEMGRYKVYDENQKALMAVNWDGSVYAMSQLGNISQKKNWELQRL